MAINNLRCFRLNDKSVLVQWAWNAEPEMATIVVTRLLDGAEVERRVIAHVVFQQALNSPEHGLKLAVDKEPVRITVRDGESEKTVELVDKNSRYIVEWNYIRRVQYRRSFLRGPELVSSETQLAVNFPCAGDVPYDLFYYVLARSGQEPNPESDPVGFLPGLRQGKNFFGVIPYGGRMPVLYRNPRHETIGRLFELKKLPDQELRSDL